MPAFSYPHCAGCGGSRGAWYDDQVPGFLCARCWHKADHFDPGREWFTSAATTAAQATEVARNYGEFLYRYCAWCGDYLVEDASLLDWGRRFVHDRCKAAFRTGRARPALPLDVCPRCFQVRTPTGACQCTD